MGKKKRRHFVAKKTKTMKSAVCEVCEGIFFSTEPGTCCPDHMDFKAKIMKDLEELDMSEGETESNEPEDSRPQIDLYDPSQLQHYVDAKANDPEHAAAAKKLSERAASAGGPKRLLGVLPDDWEKKLTEFESSFANFSKFFDHLRNEFALSSMADKRVAWRPVLLVGPPGVGKTEVARSVSEAFNLPHRVFDMASAQSGSVLTGSEQFWSNAQPGQLFELLAYEKLANPVVMLDELDKVTENVRYSPSAGLLTLLEQSSARSFRDLCVNMEIDASHVNWIGTANDANKIPAPLLSRMTVLHISAPTAAQSLQIVPSVYQRLLDRAPWGRAFSNQLATDVVAQLAQKPPRELASLLQRALGNAAQDKRTFIQVSDLPAPDKTARPSIGFLRA